MAKPARPTRSRPAYYVLPIEAWNWNWSFGINDMPTLGPQAFADFRHLVITGPLLRPKKFADWKAKITFVPRAGLEDVLRSDLKAEAVTSLHIKRGKAEAIASMPLDVLGPLLTVLAADRLHHLVLSGRAAERGSAEIRRFSFQDGFDPGEYPPDE